MIYLCDACGTSYEGGEVAPTRCRICQEERQYVPVTGQRWSTPDVLHHAHANVWKQYRPNILTIRSVPKFAIGQRAFLILEPTGNILWDCLACLDPATIHIIRRLGGIRSIAISHPHYYTTMQDWAAAFDAKIYLHDDDRRWVVRDSTNIEFWEGETLALSPELTLVRLGGHFDGGCVLHSSGDGGLVFGSDILQISPGCDKVSFMWSYPNLLPLSVRKVEQILTRLRPLDFDRLVGAFDGQEIDAAAKEVVAQSVKRYVRCLDH